MRSRLAAFGVLALAAAACPPPSNLCTGTRCGTGLVCDPLDGLCKLPAGAGDGGAGSDAGPSKGNDAGGPIACVPSCGGITPVCDTTIGVCKFCTSAQGMSVGCGGTTTVCDPSGNGGIGDCITCTA